MRKFKILFLALFLLVITPFNVFADEPEPKGAGEWNVIHNSTYTATPSGSKTATVTSGGGDVRVCIANVNPGNSVGLQFFTSSGQALIPVSTSANNNTSPSARICFEKVNVRPFVDSNGKVNIYVKMTSFKGNDSVAIEIHD